MQKLSDIKALLEKKQQEFDAFAQATARMLECPSEELEELIMQRNVIIQNIEVLDSCIYILVDESEYAQALPEVLANSANRGELPQELCEVYDRCSAIKAQIRHIQADEQQAVERLRIEQAQTLKQIKDNNRVRGMHARYLNSVQPAPLQGELKSV